jgi:hypothetical protein
VERLKKGKYKSLEQIKEQGTFFHTECRVGCLKCIESTVLAFTHSADDDDVVLGQQKLSLKCPVSLETYNMSLQR